MRFARRIRKLKVHLARKYYARRLQFRRRLFLARKFQARKTRMLFLRRLNKKVKPRIPLNKRRKQRRKAFFHTLRKIRFGKGGR